MQIKITASRGSKRQPSKKKLINMVNIRCNYFFSSSSSVDARDLIDKGLRSVAQNDFEDGLTFFQNALKMDPKNVTVGSSIRQ